MTLELPPGFRRVEHEGATLVLRATLESALLAAGLAHPDELVARAPAAGLKGRGALARFALPGGQALLSLHRRGGLIGKLWRRLSLDPERATAELCLQARALERGASVVEPLAAVTRRAGIGFEHAFATRELEGARDLARSLAESRGRARRQDLAAAGEAVRRLHEAGVDHPDLNLKNVLLAGEPVRGVVIDLDRGVLRATLAPARRRASLVRLLRSFVKLSHATAVSPRDAFRFARGYARGERAVRRELIAWGRAALPWIRLRARVWRLLGVVPRAPGRPA